MTETSRVWDGTTDGDAVNAAYDSSEFSEILQSLAAAAGVPTNLSGVFRGVDNVLGYTIGSNKVTIATGKALVAGRWYKNTAPVDLTIGDASTGRRDRVVLRRDTAVQTVRLHVISGVDNGSGTAPAMTQDASTWDEPLYIFNKAPGGGGAITLITDSREYIPRHGDVSLEGSAAAHAYAQISGAPASANSAPVNAGLTRTASAGSDTGHYANDDHVHKVDPVPGGYVAATIANSSTTPVLAMQCTVEAGVTYSVDVLFICQGELGIATLGIPSGSIVGSGSIGPDPTLVDTGAIQASAAAGQFYVGVGSDRAILFHATVVIGGTGGLMTVYFGRDSATPFGYFTAAIAGSFIRAVPIT